MSDTVARDRVIDALTAALPGLTRSDGAAALDRAKITRPGSLRALADHLGKHGRELVTGPNTEPWPLVKLVYALRHLGRTDVVLPACAGCGTVTSNLIRKNPARQRICGRCYQRPVGRCERCGRERPIVRRAGEGKAALCNGCYQGPTMTCSRCGRLRVCPKYMDGEPVCQACMVRPVHQCVECGQQRPAQAFWPIGPVCRACYAAARANPQRCPSCQRLRPLIAEDDGGRRICGGCGGTSNDHACRRCGTAGSLYADRSCAACVLRERVTALLTGPDGLVAAHLVPVRDALASVERPASVAAWLNSSPTAAGLARLAMDPRPISHDLVDELGTDPDVRHLRAILTNTGVLPARSERLERLERWLQQTLQDQPAHHVTLVRPFAQWMLLRRARQRAGTRDVTQASAGWIRAQVRAALLFLTWVDAHGLRLAVVTQSQVDRWLDEGTTYRYALRPFLLWARQRQLAGAVEVLPPPVGSPVHGNSEHVQWQQLRRCLHDTTMPLDIRVAGGLVLLFGVKASTLVEIQHDHLEHAGEATLLRIATHALPLPPLLASIIVEQRDRADLRSVFGRTGVTGIRWLFPGLRPGRPMDANSLAEKLNDNGIVVRAARNTALAELAADLPPAVLAELVGIGVTTATRWAAHARRDWIPYLAARIDNDAGRR